MEWISVNDELPSSNNIKDRTQFLVCYYYEINGKCGDVFFGVSRLNEFQYGYNGMIIFEEKMSQNITHWMPLPEPPKE